MGTRSHLTVTFLLVLAAGNGEPGEQPAHHSPPPGTSARRAVGRALLGRASLLRRFGAWP